MRVVRMFSIVLLAVILMSATPAWAAPPTKSTSHLYGTGAVAEYQLPAGAWSVSFGATSYYYPDGQRIEQPAVGVSIFESSYAPDGRSWSGYGLDGSAIVPAEAITIAPNLDTAVLAPVEVTASGWACSSWFDDTLGTWQSECHEITQTTTVSATLTATGPAELSLVHETDRSNEFFRYRFTFTTTTHNRPATGTATAFDRTASDPVAARIATQLSVGASISWQPES
jgi:hypothetical protein